MYLLLIPINTINTINIIRRTPPRRRARRPRAPPRRSLLLLCIYIYIYIYIYIHTVIAHTDNSLENATEDPRRFLRCRSPACNLRPLRGDVKNSVGVNIVLAQYPQHTLYRRINRVHI